MSKSRANRRKHRLCTAIGVVVVLAELGMETYADRIPEQLSGGERQGVANTWARRKEVDG